MLKTQISTVPEMQCKGPALPQAGGRPVSPLGVLSRSSWPLSPPRLDAYPSGHRSLFTDRPHRSLAFPTSPVFVQAEGGEAVCSHRCCQSKAWNSAGRIVAAQQACVPGRGRATTERWRELRGLAGRKGNLIQRSAGS